MRVNLLSIWIIAIIIFSGFVFAGTRDFGAIGANVTLGNTVFVDTGGGNVGIGTINPEALLDIFGSGDLFNIASSSGDNVMRIDSYGRAFIGNETSPKSSGVLFEVFDSNTSSGDKNIAAFRRSYDGVNSAGLLISSDAAGLGGIVKLKSSGSSSQNMGLGATGEELYITTAGKVGIGTTSPSRTLEIASTEAAILVNDTDSGDANILITNDGIHLRTGGFGGSVMWGLNPSENYISVDSSENMVFKNNGRNAMYINSMGRLTLSDSTSSVSLDVNGSVNISKAGSVLYFPDGTNLSTGDFGSSYVPYTGATDNIDLGANNLTVDTNVLHVDSTNDRVGIGTTTPVSLLDVNGIASIRGGSGIDLLRFYDTTPTQRYSIQRNNDDLRFVEFYPTSTTIMTLQDGGNVGIGTTSPTQKLDVNGSVNISENIYLYGNLSSEGADYAEYFDAEEDANPSDIIGLNPTTRKARVYREGDIVLGVCSSNPTVIGNTGAKEGILVGLVGQVSYNPDETVIIGGKVMTTDGKRIGYLLSDDKVLIRPE